MNNVIDGFHAFSLWLLFYSTRCVRLIVYRNKKTQTFVTNFFCGDFWTIYKLEYFKIFYFKQFCKYSLCNKSQNK